MDSEKTQQGLDGLLFDLPCANPQHPAKYTDALISSFVNMLRGAERVVDPFGGTGKVFLLNKWYPSMEIQAVEIEPEWARINSRTTLGNALALPWKDGYFDAVCTSPTYGNRMADKLPEDGAWTRLGYADKLGRNLDHDNSGAMQWGDKYRDFHVKAWKEATRVLCTGGRFVLNIKNHIRGGQEQLVTEWHIETLQAIGYDMIEHKKINTPSMRYGQNSDKRIEYESVILFIKKLELL
jgi:hypothetical protein